MLTQTFWNWRNAFDFALRRLLGWSIRSSAFLPSSVEFRQGLEVFEFLEKFPWKEGAGPLTVVDVGCRTFFLAEPIDRLFREMGYTPYVHGVEVDAYRRLADFRTRLQHGQANAASIAHGTFHPTDFLKWETPADVILLLHPFVKERAVLAWGLPLRFLKPEALFQRCADTLKPGGVLLVSGPTEEELEMSCALAMQFGFSVLERASWLPTSGFAQKTAGYGVLFEKH